MGKNYILSAIGMKKSFNFKKKNHETNPKNATVKMFPLSACIIHSKQL